MKKHILTVFVVSLAFSTLVFCFLWQHEKNNMDDLHLLAQASANDAYTHFSEYKQSGNESCYWNGVASFRSFEQAYYLLTENTSKATNYTFCNEVYGALVVKPEKCQRHIEEISEVLYILAQDFENENGYVKLFELRNILEYE